MTDSSSDDEVDDEPPTKTRRAGPKGRSAGAKGTAKLNSAVASHQTLEHSGQSHEQPTAEAKVHDQDTRTQSRQVERLYTLAARPPVITASTPPTPPGYAALSTEFNESVAAWGAKMKSFGMVTDGRILIDPNQGRPPNRMEDSQPKGSSHHQRCGVVDWHTGPTPDRCLGGGHAPLDVDTRNLNMTESH